MPGFRIDFDARDARVYFLYGYQVIDSMAVGEFKTAFDVAAVRRLIHGDAYSRGVSREPRRTERMATTASRDSLRESNEHC